MMQPFGFFDWLFFQTIDIATNILSFQMSILSNTESHHYIQEMKLLNWEWILGKCMKKCMTISHSKRSTVTFLLLSTWVHEKLKNVLKRMILYRMYSWDTKLTNYKTTRNHDLFAAAANIINIQNEFSEN